MPEHLSDFFFSKIKCIGLVREHLGFFCLIQKSPSKHALKIFIQQFLEKCTHCEFRNQEYAFKMIIQQFLEKFTHYEFRNHMQFTTCMIVLPIINKSFPLIKVNSSFYLIIFTCSYCYSASETTPKKCMGVHLKLFKYWDIVITSLLNILFPGCYGLHVCVLRLCGSPQTVENS